MVNNPTNINTTNHHISPKEYLNSEDQQFHQYQQKSPLTWTHWVMVNNSTNINKTNNHLWPKESLNSDGQLFYQYQQNKQSPLT